MQTKKAAIHPTAAWELLFRIVDILWLFTAMYLSELFIENTIFGGAVYILGDVWVIYARLYSRRSIHLLPRATRNKGVLIFVLAIVLTILLVFFYPYIQSKPGSIALFACVALFIAHQIITELAARAPARTNRAAMVRLVLAHAGFLVLHALLIGLCYRLIPVQPSAESGGVFACILLVSGLLLLAQAKERRQTADARGDTAQPPPDPDSMLEVHSYRVYNKMAVNTFVAINLSITAFIGYMRFLPYTGFLASALALCCWLAYIAAVTAACFLFLRRRVLPKYDRPAVFAFGLILWIAGSFGALYSLWGSSLWASLFNGALIGLSAGCMLSIVLIQSYEMKTVIELGVGHIDQGAYARNTVVMLDWSALMASLLLLVMFTVASFIMEGRFAEYEAILGMQRALQAIMLLLPMLFILISTVLSLLQPLDRNYAEKLKTYTRQRTQGDANPVLEERLKKILVSNYPKRIAVTLLKPILRPFFPCSVSGLEHVRLDEGPAVFVCNHLELYGPIIFVLHAPFYFRPWVLQNMLDKDAIAAQMRPGIDKVLRFIPEGRRDAFARAVSPVVIWLLQATDPIPVYRGNVRGVIQTMQLSAEAMAYDDNVLLFPETTYPQQGVGEFFTGFVQVGKLYYKQTGRSTTFYPVYISKKKKRLQYGAGIRFDPDNTNNIERDRIVDYLRGAMNDMAEQ